MKVTRLEYQHLSNGDLITVTRYGNKYGFMHGFTEWAVAPECHNGLSKDMAYKMYADAIKSDVMDC